jgi:hypothetical protein
MHMRRAIVVRCNKGVAASLKNVCVASNLGDWSRTRRTTVRLVQTSLVPKTSSTALPCTPSNLYVVLKDRFHRIKERERSGVDCES